MIRDLLAFEDARPAALMRIGLGLVLLWDAAVRWPYVVELYSSAGMPMPLFPGTAFDPPALEALPAVVCYSLLLFSLACIVVGWQTRWSLLLALLFAAWFGLLDGAGTFKKYSVIGLHLLLLLTFARSGAVWSIDARVRGRRRNSGGSPPSIVDARISPAWPRFLMRVLVSAVYLGAVATKIRMPDFGSGDLLTFSLLDHRWGGGRFGMFLATRPKLMILLSYAATLFEMSAALLLWVPQARRTMLLLAVLFHTAVGLAMTIGIFSPMMLVALLAFVREADVDALRRWLRNWSPGARSGLPETGRKLPAGAREAKGTEGARRAWISRGAFVALAVAFAGLGVVHQQTAGYARLFGEPPPPEWVMIDEETQQAILLEEPPPLKDSFVRVEIGSRRGFRHAFGPRDEFRPGDPVYCIARLQQRHPEMWLLWQLEDADGKEHARKLIALDAPPVYVEMQFVLPHDDVPQGRWAVVLTAMRRDSPAEPGGLAEPATLPEEIVRMEFDVDQ